MCVSNSYIFLMHSRFPNAFAVNASTSGVSAGPSPLSTATLPGASPPSLPPNPSNALESSTLKIEEVKPPATGTRKAKVLYDYDAADTSELSLLADEVSHEEVCFASLIVSNQC